MYICIQLILSAIRGANTYTVFKIKLVVDGRVVRMGVAFTTRAEL